MNKIWFLRIGVLGLGLTCLSCGSTVEVQEPPGPAQEIPLVEKKVVPSAPPSGEKAGEKAKEKEVPFLPPVKRGEFLPRKKTFRFRPKKSSGDQEPLTITTEQTNADVAELLRLLVKANDRSIVVSSEVTGTMTVDFDQVPVDQAFQSILEVANLEVDQSGDLVIIRPKNTHRVLGVFEMRNIDVSKVGGLLSAVFEERISLQIDPNANLVIASGPKDALEELGELVGRLDKSPKQVLIDAAIVEVTLTDEMKRGVNFNGLFKSKNLDGTFETLGFVNDPNSGGLEFTGPVGFFGTVGTTTKSVDALVELLDTVVDLKVLSHPKIMGVNDVEGKIIVGQKLGYRLSTTTQTISTETIQFLEVGTQLKFTPHITENGEIIMDIHPEVSEGSVSEDGLPNETTTEITTRVRVRDGQTIVLGGLIRERKEERVEKVPLLGSIPLLGILFRRTVTNLLRTEILIFITPHIIKTEAQLREAQREIDQIMKKHRDGMGG